MDIIQELRDLAKKDGIKNLGIGLDLNKLVLLMNSVKVDMHAKSQLIRGLEARVFYYKNKACDLACGRLNNTDKCPKTCSMHDPSSSDIWCQDVVNLVLDSSLLTDNARYNKDKLKGGSQL